MILDKHHFFLQNAKYIYDIAKPLMNHFNITDFTYLKVFSNGARIHLMSNSKWQHSYYKNNFCIINDCEKNFWEYPVRYSLYEAIAEKHQKKLINVAREEFNIAHTFYLINIQSAYCEVYFFSTPRDHYNIVNFYFEHVDILEKFIHYFHEKAFTIIQKAHKHKLFIPENKIQETDISKPPFRYSLKQFLENICKGHLNNPMQLTSREIECIQYASIGLTAKEIAYKLNLSYRTIEHYLASARNKFGFKKTTALISYVKKLSTSNDSDFPF